MVQFRVGDSVTLQASVNMTFCGAGNIYNILDINISTGTYTPVTGSPCPGFSLSGIQLEFQWVNSRGSTETHLCQNTPILATLGNAYTDPNGVVSIPYKIIPSDLTLFQSNSIFDLRVCIKNISQTFSLGKVRDDILSHSGDHIIILDPCTGISCPPVCTYNSSTNLWESWSQKCVNGTCVNDQLIYDPSCCNPWQCRTPLDGIEINRCGQTRPTQNPACYPTVPVYELILQLSPDVSSTYVANTINRFKNIFNDTVLSYVSGIIISPPVYDSINHRITIDMQESTLGMHLLAQPMHYYQLIQLPVWILLINLLPVVLSIPLLIVGYIISHWNFGLKQFVTSTVVIETCVKTGSFCTLPSRDVTIEFNGETKTVTYPDYRATFTNVKNNATYDIKAYIPTSPGSKANYATIKPGTTIFVSTDPINTIKLQLDVDATIERDFKLCNVKMADGTPASVGTKVSILAPIRVTQTVGTQITTQTIVQNIGIISVQNTGCTNILKIPGYLTDGDILQQFLPVTVDINQPDPTPVPGGTTTVNRYSDTKNKITVSVYSLSKEQLIPDKIDIRDITINKIIKTVTPKLYTTEISGIPSGNYRIEVTKSGYRLSLCPNCDITFTGEVLGVASTSVILESTVKTCQIIIYALDNYGKKLKTTTRLTIDKGTPQEISPADGYTVVSEIIAGTHKFSLEADGYKSIIDEERKISCTEASETVIFKMVITNGGPNLETKMSLTINNSLGTISVAKNADVNIKVTGATAGEAIYIYDITQTPDQLLDQGIADPSGEYTKTLKFNIDTTIELQASQGCLLGICLKSSNIVNLKVGAGAKECAVPNPLGGCLVEKTTAYGFMALAGLGLLFGIMLLRPGGAAERVIERYPVPSVSPQKEVVPKE